MKKGKELNLVKFLHRRKWSPLQSSSWVHSKMKKSRFSSGFRNCTRFVFMLHVKYEMNRTDFVPVLFWSYSGITAGTMFRQFDIHYFHALYYCCRLFFFLSCTPLFCRWNYLLSVNISIYRQWLSQEFLMPGAPNYFQRTILHTYFKQYSNLNEIFLGC